MSRAFDGGRSYGYTIRRFANFRSYGKESPFPFPVTIVNSVEEVIRLETGDVVQATIPRTDLLIKTIAVALTRTPYRLSSNELAFMRNAANLSVGDVADDLGVDITEYLLWEVASPKVIPASSETMFRAMIATHLLSRPFWPDDFSKIFHLAEPWSTTLIDCTTLPNRNDPCSFIGDPFFEAELQLLSEDDQRPYWVLTIDWNPTPLNNHIKNVPETLTKGR